MAIICQPPLDHNLPFPAPLPAKYKLTFTIRTILAPVTNHSLDPRTLRPSFWPAIQFAVRTIPPTTKHNSKVKHVKIRIQTGLLNPLTISYSETVQKTCTQYPSQTSSKTQIQAPALLNLFLPYKSNFYPQRMRVARHSASEPPPPKEQHISCAHSPT